MDQAGTEFTGRCGCGNVRARLTLTKHPQDYTARQCQCSFCVNRGALYCSDPAGAFEVAIEDETQVLRHRFGTNTADFLVCKRCDAFVGAVCDTPMGFRAVINLKFLEGSDALASKIEKFDYDAETTEQRLARRGRNWTPAKVMINGR